MAGSKISFEEKPTKKEKLRDKLAKQYYGMPYRDLCSLRQEIIDKYVKQQLKDAPK